MGQYTPTNRYIRGRWMDFARNINAQGDANAVFDVLAGRYSEPHRRYHTFGHIGQCLGEFDQARHSVAKPLEVEMAIWFHDAIYDSRARDNEERSAKLAHDTAKNMGQTTSFARGVSDLILVTKHDVVPSGIDAKVLVDVDLSILGKPRNEFDDYEAGIREEYSWVSEEDFRKARITVLRGFLERPFIYSTKHFRGKYERQALDNISYSISKLRRGHSQISNISGDLPEAGIGMFDHYTEDD